MGQLDTMFHQICSSLRHVLASSAGRSFTKCTNPSTPHDPTPSAASRTRKNRAQAAGGLQPRESSAQRGSEGTLCPRARLELSSSQKRVILKRQVVGRLWRRTRTALVDRAAWTALRPPRFAPGCCGFRQSQAQCIRNLAVNSYSIDMIAPSLAPERRDADAQGAGRFFERSCLRECSPYVLALDFIQRGAIWMGGRRSRGLENAIRQVFSSYQASTTQDRRPFNRVE
jgi:hypothetical protein